MITQKSHSSGCVRKVVGWDDNSNIKRPIRCILILQVSAGGSLANILVGLGQLAAARQRIASLHCSNNHAAATSSTPISAATSSSNPMTIKVAMTGCVVGSDALGEFAAAQLEAAAVEVVPTQPPSSSATGVVMVLTTPDAQRSFLSSFSSKDRIVLTYELKATVARSRLVVIEGYMWEVQGAAEVIPEIIRHARSCGTLVALTAGDASVVQRHASKVLAAIDAGIDIWFGNEVEAAALVCSIKHQQAQQGPQQQVQHSITANTSSAWQQTAQMQLERADSTDSSSSNVLNNQVHGRPVSHGQECALELASICPMIVVTDGSRGSYITALGQLIVVPPYWNANSPVDTCGAGDAYAAGLLYSFLTGLDLHSMGQVAAKTASAVISKHGPQLLPEDADWVAAGMLQQQGGLSTALAGAGAITQAVRPVVKVHWSPVKDAAVGGAAAGSGMNNNINGPQQ